MKVKVFVNYFLNFLQQTVRVWSRSSKFNQFMLKSIEFASDLQIETSRQGLSYSRQEDSLFKNSAGFGYFNHIAEHFEEISVKQFV